MRYQRGLLFAAVAIVTSSAGLGASPQAPKAQPPSSRTATYTVLIGSGFLCETDNTLACPDTVKGESGDSYEMIGAGTFDAQTKSVRAAGTFAHKSPNGNVLDTGVWISTELVSFLSYGSALGPIPDLSLAIGPNRFGPKSFAMQSDPVPTGGLAVFRIRLLPMHSQSGMAVLQVNCTLGEVPRERSVEGIRLTLGKNNSEYSEEINGRVMFQSMRPEISTPVKEQ